MKEFIDKLIERLEEYQNKLDTDMWAKESYNWYGQFCNGASDGIDDAISIVNQLAEETDKGNISDGYHTFNELYHHRAVLFSVICNSHKGLAWKSKLHDSGDMYEGMFIVGIETPEGQATYHYDINPYWDMFKVKELPKAPKWDGHTPSEAIRRIGLLAEEYNKKQEHVVWLNGCDDDTVFTMEMTNNEYEFLKRVSELANETSTYGCMPRMFVDTEGE